VLQAGQFPYAIAPAVLIFYAVLGVIFHVFTLKFNPEQKVRDPLALLTLSAWIIVGRLIEVLALFTLDSRDWGTRAKKGPAGSPEPVQRTEAPVAKRSVPLPRFAFNGAEVNRLVMRRPRLAASFKGSARNAMVEQAHPPLV
jgi:hypothetical protein